VPIDHDAAALVADVPFGLHRFREIGRLSPCSRPVTSGHP
jgi:hypothetical protein